MKDKLIVCGGILMFLSILGLPFFIIWYEDHRHATKNEVDRESVGKFITADQTPGGWGTSDKTVVKTDRGVFVVSGHRVRGMKDDECFIVYYDYGKPQFEVGKWSYRLR